VCDFLLGLIGDAVPRLGCVRPHGCGFHGFYPVKHRSNPNFFASLSGTEAGEPVGRREGWRRWRRAARIGAPFVALVIWVVAAVGLVAWAAAQ